MIQVMATPTSSPIYCLRTLQKYLLPDEGSWGLKAVLVSWLGNWESKWTNINPTAVGANLAIINGYHNNLVMWALGDQFIESQL